MDINQDPKPQPPQGNDKLRFRPASTSALASTVVDTRAAAGPVGPGYRPVPRVVSLAPTVVTTRLPPTGSLGRGGLQGSGFFEPPRGPNSRQNNRGQGGQGGGRANHV